MTRRRSRPSQRVSFCESKSGAAPARRLIGITLPTRMTDHRLHRILANFGRGAITEGEVCAYLIDLAGDVGGEAIVPALPAELLNVLRQHPLVSEPPRNRDDVLIVESYCGPVRSQEEWARIDRERRENVQRGGWALHRALHGSGGGG